MSCCDMNKYFDITTSGLSGDRRNLIWRVSEYDDGFIYASTGTKSIGVTKQRVHAMGQ